MKKWILTLLAPCFCICSSNLHAQTEGEIQELFAMLQNKQYTAMVNKICVMRKEEYYKNAFMDYCLAYGYCQLERPETSTEWFEHLLVSYNNISAAKRIELEEMKIACQNPEVVSASTDDMLKYLRAWNTEGFEGNQAGIESKMGIPSFSDRVEEVDFEHVTFDTQNRQFTQQQKSEASIYYKTLLNDDTFLCDSTEHLLVFYSKYAIDVNNQIAELEKYYEYYSEEFKLGESNRLITVFYCSGRSDFDKAALKVHQLNVPKSTFGYASSTDLIMLGIANVAWLGALKHELFHLMIRSFVGDIPAWLDEGIACYYESSNVKNGRATVNMRNYRTNIFQDLDEIRHACQDDFQLPTVQQFTNYSWQEYSGKTGDLMIKASLNYSISYVFIKFLSDSGKLNHVVDSFRNRTFEETLKATGDDGDLTILHVRKSDEILIREMNVDFKQIQSDFEKWCVQNLEYNPYLK